jgi:uncharacterized SAM-binding protein YcdF (DUF218 family)
MSSLGNSPGRVTAYSDEAEADAKATVAEPGGENVARPLNIRFSTRRSRRIRRWLLVLSVLLIAATIAGWPIYVQPQIDRLRHADAILVLGGYGSERLSLGYSLNVHGWAPVVVVSAPREAKSAWIWRLCAKPHPHLNMRCFAPDPPTTKGEGRELRRLAEENGWRTVIVVTFRPHISRARFILEQCFHGELIMIESPAQISAATWMYQYVYQTAGYARAVLQPGC